MWTFFYVRSMRCDVVSTESGSDRVRSFDPVATAPGTVLTAARETLIELIWMRRDNQFIPLTGWISDWRTELCSSIGSKTLMPLLSKRKLRTSWCLSISQPRPLEAHVLGWKPSPIPISKPPTSSIKTSSHLKRTSRNIPRTSNASTRFGHRRFLFWIPKASNATASKAICRTSGFALDWR